MIKGKASMLGAASGAVAGLVAITPACGNVGLMGALVIGFVAGFVCLWGVNGLKQHARRGRLARRVRRARRRRHRRRAADRRVQLASRSAARASSTTGSPASVVAETTRSAARSGSRPRRCCSRSSGRASSSLIAYKIVDLTIGLRVSEEEEREGLDITRARRDRVPQLIDRLATRLTGRRVRGGPFLARAPSGAAALHCCAASPAAPYA